MKEKVSKTVDVLIEVINYIVISFALSSVAMSLWAKWISILFFYSNAWLTINLRKRLKEVIGNGVIAEIVCWGSVAAFIAIVYFVGYVKGTIVPFRS